MTVRQNLSYGLKNRRVPKDEIERRVKKVAEILFIANFLDRKPRQLFGAQSQYVAMWQAIVCASRRPFCLMSYLSNLDAKLRARCGRKSAGCISSLRQPAYVTHDQVGGNDAG